MKRALRTAFAVLLALSLAGAATAQQPAATTPAQQGTPGVPRLAWINSQAILAQTPGRAEAESLFAREMAGARTEVQRMSSELDSALAQYNRAAAAMTPAAKQQREDQLRQMESRNRTRAQELDTQMQQRENELTAPMLTRINAIIDGVRAEYNYAFVFDVAAQGNPIVTADRTLDITALIIQRLQAAGPVPAPGQAGPPPLATPGDSTRPATPAAPAATPPASNGPRLRPRP